MVDIKNQERKASDGHKKPTGRHKKPTGRHKKPMVDIKNQECVQEF